MTFLTAYHWFLVGCIAVYIAWGWWAMRRAARKLDRGWPWE